MMLFYCFKMNVSMEVSPSSIKVNKITNTNYKVHHLLKSKIWEIMFCWKGLKYITYHLPPINFAEK